MERLIYFLVMLSDSASRYHPDPRFLPYPSQHIAIRGTQEERYLILEVPPPGSASNSGGNFLEEIEFSRALFEVCLY